MTTNPPHDSDEPMSYVNGLEAAVLSAQTKCPHCDVTKSLLPMPGNGWGVELFHEPGCPVAIAEEEQPAAEWGFTEHDDGPGLGPTSEPW